MPRAAAPVIETGRLVLRGLETHDLDALSALYSDPEVYEFLGGHPHPREDVWRRLMAHAGSWVLNGYGYWALEDKASQSLVGIAGYSRFERGIDPVMANAPEIGWALASIFHGQRLSTEALQAIQAWGDQNLGANETCCIIDRNNAPSLHVAEKLGFSILKQVQYKRADLHLLLRQIPNKKAEP